MSNAKQFITIFLALGMLTLGGCATPSRLAAVPQESYLQATVPGMADVRYFIDSDTESFVRDGLESFHREQDHLKRIGHTGPLPPVSFLAISGGGDNGAFGAGLLVGWTEAGDRPEFKAVTGISTGALIAPFAYLGPDYDPQLKEVYTTIKPADIFEPRGILAALTDDGMADNAPLWRLVRKHVDQSMLDAIAREHAKGRLLLVATTNLDALQPVVWNVGAIAENGHPKALDLIHSILIASASIPGAFPPVMIDVDVNGKPHQEMHVDGGATAQVFVYPPSVNVKELTRKLGAERERKLYVIRNARLDPEWASVERQTINIAGRSISSLIQTQGIGDLYRIYLNAQRDGFDYKLAYIPSTFKEKHKEEFDTEFMQKLFDFAYQRARKGYTWENVPPGFASAN